MRRGPTAAGFHGPPGPETLVSLLPSSFQGRVPGSLTTLLFEDDEQRNRRAARPSASCLKTREMRRPGILRKKDPELHDVRCGCW